MNIKFDYCKCIRKYDKAHLRSDFWQSKHLSITKVLFGGGQKFMHFSYNEWSLQVILHVVSFLGFTGNSIISIPSILAKAFTTRSNDKEKKRREMHVR